MTHRPVRPCYEFLRADPEVELRACGASLAEVYVNAGLGLCALMAHPATVIPEQAVELACDLTPDAAGIERWLTQLLAQIDRRGLIFNVIELDEAVDSPGARAWGMAWRPGGEGCRKVIGITAVTLQQDIDGWQVCGRVSLAPPQGHIGA